MGARYTMTAEVLKRYVEGQDEPSEGLNYEFEQDPLTFEIKRRWYPDDPDDVVQQNLVIKCIAESAASSPRATERWAALHENIETVHLTYPASITISERDRITNIKNQYGVVVWRNDETDGEPTEFDVTGVVPVLDPFGRLVEYIAVLSRVEVSSA